MIDFHPHASPCHRCAATAWECIGDFTPHKGKPEDVLECAFCGLRTRVPAVARPQAAKPNANRAEFRFQFGRFKGLTFAEADAEPNGRRYLEHLLDTNEKLRDRIAEYLAGNALDSPGFDGEIVALSEVSGASACHEKRPSSQRLFG
jgi:hypothetical protein